MDNYLNIGSTPCEEDCIGVGQPGAKAECEIFKRQLERKYPSGYFLVKGFPHDFGTYYEVVARLGDIHGDGLQEKAAWDAESDDDGYWDEQAKREHTLLIATWSAA